MQYQFRFEAPPIEATPEHPEPEPQWTECNGYGKTPDVAEAWARTNHLMLTPAHKVVSVTEL